MQIDLSHQTGLRDGRPAILAGAWIDPATLIALTEPLQASHAARLHQACFDCLLWQGEATAQPDLHRFATELAARIERPLVTLPPAATTDAPPWPASLGSAEAPTLTACSPGALTVAFARQIAAGADRWTTAVFARPVDPADTAPAEALARLFHRLQTFARKQGELLLASPVVSDAAVARVIAHPPRAEITLRKLGDKPVWTVFAINPSPHPSKGALTVALGSDEVDLGTVRLRPERFAVFQITKDRRPATNRHRPVPELARQKGQSKADAVRVNALLRDGWRVRTLFRGTEV